MDASSVGHQRASLNLRIKPEVRDLIDLAAKACGKNRTEFILEAARLAAVNALLDQTFIQADNKAYSEFLRRLDQPPAPNEQLRKTMQSPAPWDTQP